MHAYTIHIQSLSDFPVPCLEHPAPCLYCAYTVLVTSYTVLIPYLYCAYNILRTSYTVPLQCLYCACNILHRAYTVPTGVYLCVYAFPIFRDYIVPVMFLYRCLTEPITFLYMLPKVYNFCTVPKLFLYSPLSVPSPSLVQFFPKLYRYYTVPMTTCRTIP